MANVKGISVGDGGTDGGTYKWQNYSDQANALGVNINTAKSKIEDLYNDCKDKMDEVWKGEAATTFMEKLIGLKGKIDTNLEKLSGIKETMESLNTDSQNKNKKDTDNAGGAFNPTDGSAPVGPSPGGP